MRLATAALLVFLLAATGCAIVHSRGSSQSALSSSKKCPPGHVWSDGSCHSKGKGHDR